MSKAAFRVAYDGEALAAHTMDVRDLAPALLALGNVFVEANKILNGEETAVEVHVTPRIEEGCFEIGLEVLQSWGAFKEFLHLSDTIAAGELVDWLFRVTGTAGGTYGLFRLYKATKGKKPENVVRYTDSNGGKKRARMEFEDGSDIVVDERECELYRNDKIRVNAGRVLNPVILKEGIDTFSAYQEGSKASGFSVSKADAREIDFTPSGPEPISSVESPDTPFEAILRVYSPVYDLDAPKWRFVYKKQRHYMDVSESNIREIVLSNGGALINDVFRVMLQRVPKNTGGKTTFEYKVLDVLEFIPAYRQGDMLVNEQQDTISKEGDEDGEA